MIRALRAAALMSHTAAQLTVIAWRAGKEQEPMDTLTIPTPVPAREHIAVAHDRKHGSWWALLVAWAKGARRG